MSDYISKQALVDYLNTTANDLFERGGIVPSGILVILRDDIESGTFDTPEMEHVNAYWAREGLIKKLEGEAARLQEELEFVRPLVDLNLHTQGDTEPVGEMDQMDIAMLQVILGRYDSQTLIAAIKRIEVGSHE